MDRYDRAIEHLLSGPRLRRVVHLHDAWSDPRGDRAGCLFAFLEADPLRGHCCCPTVWKGRNSSRLPPASNKVAAAVDDNPLIPRNIGWVDPLDDDAYRKTLEAFADVQRLADREIPGRDWSEWDRKFPA